MILTNYSGFGSGFNMEKMLSGRHLTVLTEHFENSLVLRYKGVWIIICGDDLSLKEGGGLEGDFFPGCSDTKHHLPG